jgi:hypothetical protein
MGAGQQAAVEGGQRGSRPAPHQPLLQQRVHRPWERHFCQEGAGAPAGDLQVTRQVRGVTALRWPGACIHVWAFRMFHKSSGHGLSAAVVPFKTSLALNSSRRLEGWMWTKCPTASADQCKDILTAQA